MSDEKQETIEEVVAEMRNRDNLDGGEMCDNFSLDAALGEYGGYDALMLLKAYADRIEAAWKREVEEWNALRVKVADFENTRAQMIRYKEEASRRSIGNAAKMREALKIIRRMSKEELEDLKDISDEVRADLISIVGWCDHALSAPARNCDVGTVEEQLKRLDDACVCGKLKPCNLENPTDDRGCESCVLKWANAPAESEVAK